jgi:hypothetical protein
MKNIHILPTNKPSRLALDGFNKLYLYKNGDVKSNKNQNIYITNDEETLSNNGDYYLGHPEYNTIHKWNMIGMHEGKQVWIKKIILTTDQDLIKDGVQAIDDKFLEWFVKNPSCESVEITEDSFFGYRPILKLKQATLVEAAMNWDYLSFEAGVKWQSQTMFTSEDMIEQATEELALKHFLFPKELFLKMSKYSQNDYLLTEEFGLDNTTKYREILGYIAGHKAKYQAKRMHSEEDMIEFAEFVATYQDKNRNYKGEMLHSKSKYDGSERTIDLLEEFKKKQHEKTINNN